MVDSTEVSDGASTSDPQNLVSTDERLHEEVNESEITPTADMNVAESVPLMVPEANAETTMVEAKPPIEPEPSMTSSQIETTSSSNCSTEETTAPPSDNSMEMLAVVTATDVQSIESTHSSDPSLSGWSGLSDARSTEEDLTKVMALEKLVVSEPSSQGRKTPSDASSNTKGIQR